MKKVCYRVFTIAQYLEEEQWLAEMAAQGWLLTAVSPFRYEFTQGEPGEYIYRLQLLEHSPAHPESQRYLGFLQEMGVEYVGCCLDWVYLRRRASEGPFELFSDVTSRIRHLRRIVRLMNIGVPLFCLEVVFLTFLLWQGWRDVRLGILPAGSPMVLMVLDALFLALIVVILLCRGPMDQTLHRLQEEQKVRE